MVQAVNDVPIAQGGSVSAVKNTTRDIPLSGSDVDLDTLTYMPVKKSKKGGVVALRGNNIVTYTPKKDYLGADSFTFTVKDNKKGVSKAATVNVSVNGSNTAPTANTGTAQTVDSETHVTLAGSGQDQDGNVTLYAWSQISETPVVTLSGANTSTPSFTAPSVDDDTSLTFRLTVTDNNGATATSDVVVTVKKAVGNIQLQGSAVPPIVGGIVTAKGLGGGTFATATTDSDGKFVFNATERNLKDGYSVSITGGTRDGVAFNETLSATYSNADAKDATNLTVVTTLLDAVAVDMPGANPLEKRDAAIQKLAHFGMIKADGWNQLTSDHFNLQALSARIQGAGGLQAWLDLIKADLADGELSLAESRSLFPKAHGGIQSIRVEMGKDSLFPGETTVASFSVDSLAAGQTPVVKIVQAPAWVTVDGPSVKVEPPIGTDVGENTIIVEVALDSNITGRRTTITTHILKQVLLLSGTLGSAGGKIENDWRDISVSAPAGVLSQTYDMSYFLGYDDHGVLRLSWKVTPDMPSSQKRQLEVIQPSIEVIKSHYVEELGTATQPAHTRQLSPLSF